MSVLNRRMFQNGGEARVIQSGVFETGSYRNPKTETQSIEEQDGVFYSRTRDQNGNLKKEEIIDLSLSANRDPIEALNIQKRNKALSTAADFLTTAPAVVGGIGGLGYLGARELAKRSLGRKLSDIFFRRDPGKVTGKYGTERIFAGQGPISGLTGTGATAVGVGTGATIGAALRSMQQGPVEPIDEVVQKDKKLSGKLFDQPKKPKKEEPEGRKVIGFQDQPLVSKVISNPNFNRFLSNLSSSLTETGSFAQGAAQAASESLKEKLEEREITSLDPKDAKTNAEFNSQLSSSINSFDKTELDIGRIEYAINLLETEGGTGLAGFFGNLLDRASALIGKDGKEFKDQSPRTQIDSILNAIRQENIRALLGESGRTISNLDREIVADIFGSITVDSPKSVLIEKLNQVVTKFRRDLNKHKGEIAGNVNYFVETGQNSPIAFRGGQLAAPIRRILSISDPFNYDVPEYIPGQDRLATPTSTSPITDIEYVEGT